MKAQPTWAGLARVAPLLAAALLAIAAPQAAQAQPMADVLDEQLRLNDEARQAASRGDRALAAELLRASLDLGPLNVTWLNLGRVYALDGRCREAIEAFDAAPGSPQVLDPPPEVVAQALVRYRKEVADDCLGALKVTCQPDTLRLEIDGQARRCGEPTGLFAGEHRVRGSLGPQVVEQIVTILPGQPAALTLRLDSAPTHTPDPVAATPTDGAAVAGWIIGGLGVAAVGGGVALRLGLSGDLAELEAISKTPGGDLDRFNAIKTNAETRQLQSFALIGLGTALAATGGAMLIAGAGPPEGGEGGGLRVRLSPLGLALEGDF